MRWRSALARPVRWLRSARFAMLLCGAALVLTFPAANLEFLAWFGLVPALVLIVRSPTAREGGVRAWWLGAGYLIAALYWMAPEIGPAVPLVAVVFGVLWIPFGVAAHKLLRPPLSWPRVLAAGFSGMQIFSEGSPFRPCFWLSGQSNLLSFRNLLVTD